MTAVCWDGDNIGTIHPPRMLAIAFARETRAILAIDWLQTVPGPMSGPVDPYPTVQTPAWS